MVLMYGSDALPSFLSQAQARFVLSQACVSSDRYIIEEFMKRPDLDINRQDCAGSPAWVYGIEAGRTPEMIS